jgi:hypothetical protein
VDINVNPLHSKILKRDQNLKGPPSKLCRIKISNVHNTSCPILNLANCRAHTGLVFKPVADLFQLSKLENNRAHTGLVFKAAADLFQLSKLENNRAHTGLVFKAAADLFPTFKIGKQQSTHCPTKKARLEVK